MKRLFILLILISSTKSLAQNSVYDFETVFEKSNGTETATYDQTIQYYSNLAEAYSEISMQKIGDTDSGKPLHMVILNPDATFDFENIRKAKRIILINNGIHPGESDGIDATMMLYRDIVQGKIEAPEKVVLVTIPIYNIGGSLIRNSSTRANQNGPKEYGFRGNAQNYDLNRDFIKCDTKNAKTFTELFHFVQPDVLIDNHVSNGADYQYILTHVFTQHNKLGGNLGVFLHNEMIPNLEQKLAEKSWDISPYVNVFNQVPDNGFVQFMDYPRYSSGYAALFNTLGLMVETHMLKPYELRVEGTYELMISMIEITDKQSETIAKLRAESIDDLRAKKTYPLNWEVDSSQTTTLSFKGYEGEMIPSEITGAQRLKYDRAKPVTKIVNYHNYFKPSIEVKIPSAYIIPQAWYKVIDLLKRNNVNMKTFKSDTILTVTSYKINDYDTRTDVYEGHYPHYNVKLTAAVKEVTFKKGDYLINTNQSAMRYIIETLEPQAPDSFFNWNFFDTILQQKEYFSPYVFEDNAKELLENNPSLKAAFNDRKVHDDAFKTNWYMQLKWLYERSEHFETAFLQYPVYRLF